MRFLRDFLRNLILLFLLALALFALAPNLLIEASALLGSLFGPLLLAMLLFAAFPRRRARRG